MFFKGRFGNGFSEVRFSLLVFQDLDRFFWIWTGFSGIGWCKEKRFPVLMQAFID